MIKIVDLDENYPCKYNYTLQGSASDISCVRKMIDDICRDYGTPDNELGLYVPMQLVIQLLVGSTDYRGNILHMEQPLPDCLTITTEADSGYPLLYALRKCFDNLEITMKESDF